MRRPPMRRLPIAEAERIASRRHHHSIGTRAGRIRL